MKAFHKIAVIGGAGFVGSYIAEELTRHSARLSIATRRRERHKGTLIQLPAADLIETNVHDAGQLETFLAGHDAVISMVGILHGSHNDFERAHVHLTGKIIAACKSQHIKRLIHISALGAAENAPSHYQQTKSKAERLLRDSDLDVTILRPSVIFGAGDSFLSLFAKLSACAPFIPLAGAETRFAPIWAADVGRAVRACLDDNATIGQTFDLAGPNIYTLRQLVAYAANLSGTPRSLISLPEGLAMLQATLMEMLPGQPPLSRDNVRSLRVDNISPRPFPSESLGFSPTALETIAPQYLGSREINQQRDDYRTRAAR